MQATLQQRWMLIETAHPTISWPFLALPLLMLWLLIIFAIFGLTSPGNSLIRVVILLSAISVTSSLYLILDLDTPFGGILAVSSQPLRDALANMDQPTYEAAAQRDVCLPPCLATDLSILMTIGGGADRCRAAHLR